MNSPSAGPCPDVEPSERWDGVSNQSCATVDARDSFPADGGFVQCGQW